MSAIDRIGYGIAILPMVGGLAVGVWVIWGGIMEVRAAADGTANPGAPLALGGDLGGHVVATVLRALH